MKMRKTWLALLFLGAIVFSATATAGPQFRKLAGKQIAAEIAGMELTDQSHWGEVFERDGTLIITSMGHRSLGKWRVQKDQLCLDHGSEPGGGCYEVWLAGRKVELRNQSSSVPLEAFLQKPETPPRR